MFHTLAPRSPHRPLLLLLVALVLLSGTLLFQLFSRWTAPSSAPAPLNLSSEAYVEKMQARIRQNPQDADAYAQLGLARLQQVRETADAALYTQAEMAFQSALAHDPQQSDALIGQGQLALARHDFQAALAWGNQARQLNPYRAAALGILVDAYVELGQYEQAATTLQQMVDLRPDLASFTRVSYLRELYGDVPGAIEAMQRAVETGAPGHENTLWTLTQLANLYFSSGRWDEAEQIYRQALTFQPDYAYALAGMANVAAARGYPETAISLYVDLVERYPLASFVIALGDLYTVMGQPAAAAQQYELVGVIQALNANAGMNVDLELALFDADQGIDPKKTAATARAVYDRRPSIHAADALAWALYQAGDYQAAARYSQEALRLGTKDALFHYHAALIAHALGDLDAARSHLRQVQAINPAFSIRYADAARALLAQLEQMP